MQILVRPSTDGLVLQILVRVLFTHTHYYSVFQEFNLELGYMQMIVRDHAVLTHNDPPIGLASSNTLITTITTIGSHTITHPLDLDHWYGMVCILVHVQFAHNHPPIASSYTLITSITADHLLKPRGRALVRRIYSVHT